MSSSTALAGFLRSQHLPDEVFTKLKEAGVDKVAALRAMTLPEMQQLLGEEVGKKLHTVVTQRGASTTDASGASGRTAPPPAVGGRYPDDDVDRARDAGRRGRGGRGGMDDHGYHGGRGGRGGYRGAPGGNMGNMGNHPGDMGMGGPRGDPAAHKGPNRELSKDFSTQVTINADSVKFLLGCRAQQLMQIHHKYGTSNEKISRDKVLDDLQERSETDFTFIVYGPSQEAVEKAKAEIYRVTGVSKDKRKAARFEYSLNELKHNTQSVSTLAVANMRAQQSSSPQLSENVLKRVIETFKFSEQHNITHFCTTAASAVREKLDFISTKCINKMKGVQVIIFTDDDTVKHMKASGRTRVSFGVDQVYFVHREMEKKERMEALEGFKKGSENANGIINRILVTTKDTAKLARKIEIPFVNFVIHLTFPRGKEAFLLQSNCCGRNGKPGISLLFYQPSDVSQQEELAKDFAFRDHNDDDFTAAVGQLQYDTVANPLTPSNADPPEDWRERLAEEIKAKEEKKKLKEGK